MAQLGPSYKEPMSYSPNFRGIVGKGSSRQTQTGYTNTTASLITAASPVYRSASGIAPLDVTTEASVEAFVGLCAADLPTTASGLVVSDGRCENIPLSLGFSVGDAIWAGPTPGSLTNVKPDSSAPGWAAGYFVVFIGVVVANEFNPSNQDIQLFKQLVGQL